MTQNSAQATSFGAAAVAYESGRPSYPDAALDWLVPGGASRVVDLGAGTGKLSRQLLARGLDVVAVEPDDAMRAQALLTCPDLVALAGRAESIPVADASVDAVFVAQAWHWVDPPRASAEIARVLRPGGTLGLVWNIRAQDHGWLADLSRLLHAAGAAASPGHAGHERPVVAPPFGPLEHHSVPWTASMTRGQVLDMVASRSYVITLPPERRERVLTQVATLIDTHPGVHGDASAGSAEAGPVDAVAVPYVTYCHRTSVPA